MAPLSEPDPNQRSVAFLDKYAQERWDTVLHYMVNTWRNTTVLGLLLITEGATEKVL